MIKYDIFDSFNDALAHVTGDFFLSGWKDIQRLHAMAVSAHIFANNSEKEFDHLQDLIFLYMYLYLLNWDRMDIKDITGDFPTREYLYEDYCIDCVRKYFACNFIEIFPLLAEFDTAIPTGTFTGIGYDTIQPYALPPFKVY